MLGTMDEEFDVVIIGGGAAGLSAALVLGRARRKVAVIDGGAPRNAPAAHAHGFLTRDGIPPKELLEIGRDEVRAYGVEIIDDVVHRLRHDKAVELASGRVVGGRRIVVTTGLADELPDVPGVAERFGTDVLHCPYCHGWEVRDQRFGVLATSEKAIHQALIVWQWSKDLTFFTHTQQISAEDRAKLTGLGIRIVDGKVSELAVENDRLTGVRLVDGEFVERDVVFVGPKFVPHDRLLAQVGCARTESGSIAVDAQGRTNVDGVWAAGNVVDPMAQLVVAAGDAYRMASALNFDLVLEDQGATLASA
ncbi:NAD(P)/FAD-dependent oxidoreductase [Amycolatopsis keratiniphila]|uniref:NAD(P)/FAD-dependent oxidoreductase n=1 Tax=Amycolatopsis keratiniphila TaxID=129921 RepID=UPI000879EAE9|nr:NAD(P)/FAD-dependent oxidoreductase [Amycolatopsis keratiniphila]OLZ54161.1 thioredoxin reductase [Amycolatopsis keratiniphila subsp. nogabecina]SDU63825.1 Thioredoxin reductase [Amycolatopsis keratiniphila]